ncbi:hypothetical protein [Patiriisocius hiemis]|uniref:Lipoprotein n=1 Tax=Patiriisocius hiemis TaxID=3075604 RepID=A0ABU2YDW8_9FLAO|nr:hypothetical protein [Constantimarinum sp. W242]MDT0556384.1 hypothetical protein [Constantimarinum sp. W242]
MTKAPIKEKNGCLWFILTGIFSLVGFVFIHSILNFSTYISLAIAVFLSVLFVNILSSGLYKKAMFRNGIIILFLLFGFKVFFSFLGSLFPAFEETNHTFSETEGVKKVYYLEENDSVPVYQSNRIWKDNYGNNYNGTLTIRERDFLRLQGNTSKYDYTKTKNFWGGLYDYIDYTETPSLDLVLNTFEKINFEKKLNQMEFAEMVVSCIQDIPYSFVFQEECQPAPYYEDSIKAILEDCPECCIGGILYGVQTPIAFLQNLKGDCDTRTVLIYAILKHFNYDVAILNSDFYKHSIIGLNIPAAGTYKLYNGKKYLLWETTAKYYKAGTLPYNFKDVVHWDVILTSK